MKTVTFQLQIELINDDELDEVSLTHLFRKMEDFRFDIQGYGYTRAQMYYPENQSWEPKS